jgi:DNA-binding protein HU-beta
MMLAAFGQKHRERLRSGARRDFGREIQQTKGESLPMASKPATKAKTAAAAPKITSAKSPKKPGALAKAPAPPSAAKKPAAKAAPKKIAETVTLKTVFEQLAEAHDLPKKQAQSLMTGFVSSVTGILQNGDRLRMSGLGTIEVKDRPARMGRNPATGATVQIAASKKVAFRAAKELKAAV